MQDSPVADYAPPADPKKAVPRAGRISSRVEGDLVILRMETGEGEPIVELHTSADMSEAFSQRLHWLAMHASGEIDNTSIH